MKIVKQSFEFLTPIAGEAGRDMLRLIERAARTCYKSECKITPNSASAFVRNIAQVKKHVSVIEHASVTIRFICDRGISHEIVRHRLASYSQESTRYCNYSSDKFDSGITVIRPLNYSEMSSDIYRNWIEACESAERYYLRLLNQGVRPEDARDVLPTCLKTELVMTANLREWRHVLNLRCEKNAHPKIRNLMLGVLREFKAHLPELFDDI